VDDLCITTQQENFQKIEPVMESALQEMRTYYNNNHLKPNPAKTQLAGIDKGEKKQITKGI